MNVLIVARTRMWGGRRCIGGLAADGRAVRLMTSTGEHCSSPEFQIGQIWEVDFAPAANPIPPHVEDVLVTAQQLVAVQPDLRGHLLSRLRGPWRGGVDQLFGGVVGYTGSGNGYICERLGVPGHSTGYWLPDRDLVLRSDGKHYDYHDGLRNRGLSYVGEPAPPAVLPAGTLIRVSLARWWKPDDAEPDFEERCYVQLSGWYT